MTPLFDNIPNILGEDEKLVRIIFSPFHIDKKNPSKLTPNAFRPPSGIDEVSVNRLSYTTAGACKQHGKRMNSDFKTFFGLASIRYSAILEANAFARVSKLDNNPSHADIYFGVILQKGEPAPAEINLALKELAAKAKYFPDPNTTFETWLGEDISNC
jgi:hypothetical protein